MNKSMRPAKYSRERFLITSLHSLGFSKALSALFFVIDEMSIEKGFKRHDGTDYYLHIVDVTQDLVNHGIDDEDIITAAILHDSMEDIPGVNYRYISENYGEAVAIMVDLVTKDKSINYHKNEAAMQEYLDKIALNPGAALVKTADRVHNFSSMRSATSMEHKRKQVINTEKYFIPFFKKCRTSYPVYASYFYGAKYFIEPVMHTMKELIELHDRYVQPVNY